jgi:hypothetical protein
MKSKFLTRALASSVAFEIRLADVLNDMLQKPEAPMGLGLIKVNVQQTEECNSLFRNNGHTWCTFKKPSLSN